MKYFCKLSSLSHRSTAIGSKQPTEKEQKPTFS